MFDPNTCLIAGAFDGEIDLLKSNTKLPHIQALGIGNLEIALALFQYKQNFPKIESVVFLGSSGNYPWYPKPEFGVVNISFVKSLELGPLTGDTKQLPNPKETLELSVIANQYPTVGCNAPSGISLRDLKTIPNHSWDQIGVENLELYGLTRAATLLGLNVSALLAITNTVGSNGSNDWQKNWRGASNDLQKRFLQIIEST
ncbi:phosphorylase [Leptospira sp. 96542]|nr:phosphorylase [Leptospira sp. 96542]